MQIIVNIIISALALFIAQAITPGVEVQNIWTAIVVVVVLAVINALIGTVLRLLTLPLNFLTLWLVSFIISVCMIMLTSAVVDWFAVANFLWAAVFAIVLSLVNMVIGSDQWLFAKKKK